METESDALAQLETELERINRAYESGEMHAFGADQKAFLDRFAQISEAQSTLARKHVAAGKQRIM